MRNVSQHPEDNALELWNSDDELKSIGTELRLLSMSSRIGLSQVLLTMAIVTLRSDSLSVQSYSSGCTDSPGADVRG
jgi:hypothetical protein